MRALRVVLVVPFLLLALAPVGADDQGEVLKLKNQIVDLQNRGSLGFREFALCSNVLGYGSYVPLEAAVVPPGSELLIYLEPANVFTNRNKGQYEIWYTQDMVLLAEDGEVLYEQRDALNFRYASRSPVFDLYATNSLNLGDLPPGNYVFKAVLRDKLRGTAAEQLLPFAVAK